MAFHPSCRACSWRVVKPVSGSSSVIPVAVVPHSADAGLHSGDFHDLVVADGFPHATYDSCENEPFLFVQVCQACLVDPESGQDRGVAGDFLVVDGQAQARLVGARVWGDESGDAVVSLGESDEGFQIVVRDVLAVGARVGGQLPLVQALQCGKGFDRR